MKLLTCLFIFLFAGIGSLHSQASKKAAKVLNDLPYGLTWNDNDSTVRATLDKAGATLNDSGHAEHAYTLTYTNTRFLTFAAEYYDVSLRTPENGSGLLMLGWYFDETDKLTVLEVFEVLYSTLKADLGKPTSGSESIALLPKFRQFKSDSEIFEMIENEEYGLFAHWDLTVKKEKYRLYLNVDGESGYTRLSYTNVSRLESLPGWE